MAWVTVKCPHCGGMAKKISVNSSVSHNLTHSSCDKCHKRIAIETNYGKVKVFKD